MKTFVVLSSLYAKKDFLFEGSNRYVLFREFERELMERGHASSINGGLYAPIYSYFFISKEQVQEEHGYGVLLDTLYQEKTISFLQCELRTLSFKLEDWVSEETWIETNKEILILLAEDKRKEEDDRIFQEKLNACEELAEYVTLILLRENYSLLNNIFYNSEKYDFFKYDNEKRSLSKEEIKKGVKFAVKVHLAQLSSFSRMKAKMKLPIGSY